MVLNAHHLIHLAQDVKTVNCSLSRVTAFPFESFLVKLKKYIRTTNKSLSQLCRRLHERQYINRRKAVTIPPSLQILDEKRNQITSIKLKQSVITNKAPNSTVLTGDGSVVDVRTFRGDFNNRIFVIGEILEIKCPLLIFLQIRIV